MFKMYDWKSKEVTVDEIMKIHTLKREQIHRAVTRLEDRGFITKELTSLDGLMVNGIQENLTLNKKC